ncbi:helix-turn-helix domain-containing protein [Hymenobacter gummosus]|uniref:Helix-turn-helix domain-containing protein n=1 Tax=Hymenobacter gummosus TaxID=1776032 RepID=A0A431U7Z7_9BACT|nr:helix-turn-helix transcriptional regulator [Hymenobacter gummosus]RTQ52377.1 helix-turn-helix domain-containing protein [Hymenobacter gummosus]
MPPSFLDDLMAEVPQDEHVVVALIADLADQVKAEMQAQGLTRRALAQRLGKSESEVTKWLSGMHNLTLHSVAKLSVALQTDLFTTRRNPVGYFGRLPLAATRSVAAAEFDAILTNPPYNAQPTAGPMTRLLATSWEGEQENRRPYEFAA